MELRDTFREFAKARRWGSAHSPKNLAMCIAIEAAELMEIFQWSTLEEAAKVAETAEFEHVREELADVLIYCLSMANHLDIDVASAIEDKLAKNARKYPPKQAE
jgi:NTP pyrophosphatase (non-canonical NTP hydrolase)